MHHYYLIHHHLTKRSVLYRNWHSHPYHSHLHWLAFLCAGIIAFSAVFFQIEITYRPQELKIKPSGKVLGATSPVWDNPVLPLPETHPSLLFTQSEIPLLQSKVSSPPYNSWYNQVKSWADGDEGLGRDCTDPNMMDNWKAWTAKNTAFVYIITNNNQYYNKAKECLTNICKDGCNWSNWYDTWPGIQNFAEAYDMVYNRLASDGVAGQVRDKIANTVGYGEFYFSNGGIKAYSAVGTAALAMPNHPTAYQWLSDGLSNLKRIFFEYWTDPTSGQTVDPVLHSDGVYTEGASYTEFGAENFLPFMIMYEKATGQKLWDEPAIHNWMDWIVKITMPDSYAPPFDDSMTGRFSYLSALMVSNQFDDASFHRFAWEFSGNNPIIPEAIAFFDSSISSVHNIKPTNFFPDGGMAVLRGNWTENSVYGLLLSETRNAWGHEDRDQNSFLMAAYDRFLLAEPGYGPCGANPGGCYWDESNHDNFYNSRGSHNVIQMQTNQGGSDGFGLIQNYYDTSFIDYVESKTNYYNTNWARSVLFPSHKYFILIDDIDTSNSPYQYEWYFHGGTDQATVFGNGVQWTNYGVDLNLYFLKPNNVSISLDNWRNSNQYFRCSNSGASCASDSDCSGGSCQWQSRPKKCNGGSNFGQSCNNGGDCPGASCKTADFIHKRANIQSNTGLQNTRSLIVLYPKTSGVPSANVTTLSISGADSASIDYGSESDIVISKDGSSQVSSQGITTNAEISLTHFSSGSLKYFSEKKGSSYYYGGQNLYSSNQLINFTQEREGSEWEGYVKGSGSYNLSIYTGIEPQWITYQGNTVSFNYSNQMVNLSLSGEGSLRVGFSGTPPPPPPTCTCTSWQNDRCGGGSCPQNQMHQIGTNCTPAGCFLDRCVDDPSCIISNIRSDLNCDNKVNVYDFGILLSRWTFGNPTFNLTDYKTTSFYQACASFLGEPNHNHIPDLSPPQGDLIVYTEDFGILVSQWNP